MNVLRWRLWATIGGLLALAGCAAETDDDIGTTDDAIVGGKLERGSTYAAVVALADPNGIFCSGVVIAPKVVASAEHCVKDLSPSAFEVRRGFDALRPDQRIDVKSIERVTAEGTGGVAGFGADVAFLVLTKAVTNVMPLPMLERSLDAGDLDVSVRLVGYGQTSKKLADVYTRRYRKSAPGVITLVNGLPHANARVPGTVSPTTGKSLMPGYEAQVEDAQAGFSCVGDSGGPYLATVDGKLVVMALQSAQSVSAQKCTDKFAIVASFGPEVQAAKARALLAASTF